MKKGTEQQGDAPNILGFLSKKCQETHEPAKKQSIQRLIDGEVDSQLIAACSEKLRTEIARKLIFQAGLIYYTKHILQLVAELKRLALDLKS